jgi:hypothetical protein
MTTRRVVIHADDLGMSHGANRAFAELCDLGVVTSGSVMVPCPWFADLAGMCAENPTWDVGVHLTLTSEMKGYRWRPLTKAPPSSGLTDADGFLHADVPALRRMADRTAVEAELRAQIDAALGAGIDVTHVDDHMGAVLAPEFSDIYVRIAVDYGLPPVFCRDLSAYGGLHNLTGIGAAPFRRGADLARLHGFEVFDRISETDWRRSGPALPAYRAMFDATGPGLTFLALHFTCPGEIAAIDPASHRLRTDEYELFRSPAFGNWLREQPFDLTGMRPLRKAYRMRQHERRPA